MQIATSAAVRAAERAAFDSGEQCSAGLMDAVVRRLHAALAAYPGAPACGGDCLCRPARVVAYVGRGNNAGDAVGLAAAYGCPVILRGASCAEELSPDTQRQLAGAAQVSFAAGMPAPAPHTLILDGLLGSGASGELRPGIAALVRELNALRAACPQSLTVAIDIPTGLMAEGGECVIADISCPIGCVKPAMLADGAEDAVGQLLPIALPEVAIPPCSADAVMDGAMLRSFLPRRAYSCFKNRAGRVAIVAGSIGMLGAAQMAAEAALAAGAGLVVLYALPEAYPLLATRVAPEVMVHRVTSYADIDEPNAQALLIGPGLGQLPAAEWEALHALACRFAGTVVLDADALNAAATQHWELAGHANWVLTPHPGEMRRLAPDLAALPRREQAARFCQSFDGVLLLKGARSLSAQGDVCLYNGTGGPFMANGGQGDVLAGCVAALAAQGLTPLHAAASAAHACGQAAARAWQAQGYPRAVRATQTIAYLPETLASCS